MEWITNCMEKDADDLIKRSVWILVKGEPEPNPEYGLSVEDMKSNGLIGIYRVDTCP